ncbi:MAG TPA: hypothetical protein VFT59_01335 [Candidatus Saccharimonadales bacterium]|nr:hypothetical protein [Candidatus Saccharimonadales bacterium]
MKTEIEAKFLQIDLDTMRAKLREAGATCKQRMQVMRRVTFSTPEMDAKMHIYVFEMRVIVLL